jgi:hypothetical protein
MYKSDLYKVSRLKEFINTSIKNGIPKKRIVEIAKKKGLGTFPTVSKYYNERVKYLNSMLDSEAKLSKYEYQLTEINKIVDEDAA